MSRSKQPRHRRSEQPRRRQADTAAAAPCPKCETNALFTKQYLVFDGDGPPRRQALFRESFTYQFVNPNAELVWDMERARAILAKHPRDPQLVDPDGSLPATGRTRYSPWRVLLYRAPAQA